MDIFQEIIADYGNWFIVAIFGIQAVTAIIDFLRGRKTKKQMLELNKLFSNVSAKTEKAENGDYSDDYLLQLSLRFCELLTEYYERNDIKKK